MAGFFVIAAGNDAAVLVPHPPAIVWRGCGFGAVRDRVRDRPAVRQVRSAQGWAVRPHGRPASPAWSLHSVPASPSCCSVDNAMMFTVGCSCSVRLRRALNIDAAYGPLPPGVRPEGLRQHLSWASPAPTCSPVSRRRSSKRRSSTSPDPFRRFLPHIIGFCVVTNTCPRS